MNSNNDVIQVIDDPRVIDHHAWNALLSLQARPTPFMRMEYLAAMHGSNSAVPETGWMPQFITIHNGGRLVAAAPAYLKSHSYGEYVFDWAWAEAYERHGLRYFPKLLVAVPFTPVPGTRLMASDDAARRRLLTALAQLAQQTHASSAHVLFPDSQESAAFQGGDWMMRSGVQFHWQRDPHAPARTFDLFLATLQREKRKKILQERRRVRDAGVSFTAHEAGSIDEELWDFFYRCYLQTYAAHRSTPYLTRAFFRAMAANMPQNWLMFVGRRDDAPIACSLIVIDRPSATAYGRYWGCTEYVDCMHFEACYYQPLEWCMANGMARFEGGAQGEHKMARGLMPVATQSHHWLAHPQFARAVDTYLQQEGAGMSAYVNELLEHNPFKSVP